ncbi:UNVERIFIED_CONTAM: hypothetical protein Scaly_2711200 [Sesamum calycinum]|uniref:Peptidase A1 domain-containing protein n=1 Tax=Sesamum calycinum TaxID=2727403 RepID=A0AAW2J396_9LAMI
MAGWVLKVMAAVVAVAAATLVSAVSGGAGIQRVLTLERVFPVGERLELEVIKARDRARHARILQSFSGGIVDFPVLVHSFLLVMFELSTSWRGRTPEKDNLDSSGSSPCNNCPQSSGLGIPLNFSSMFAASSTVSPISCSDNVCASIVQTASAECSAESNQYVVCIYALPLHDRSNPFYAVQFAIVIHINQLDSRMVLTLRMKLCSTSLFGDLTKSDSSLMDIRVWPAGSFSLITILYLQSIAVNGEVTIDPAVFTTSGNQGTIVDSGTTLAYLVEGAYDPFVSAVIITQPTSELPLFSQEFFEATTCDNVTVFILLHMPH